MSEFRSRGFVSSQLEEDGCCDSLQYPSVPIFDSGVGLESYSTHSGNLSSDQLSVHLDRLRITSQSQQNVSLIHSEQISAPEYIPCFTQNEDGDTLLHLSIIQKNSELSLQLIQAAQDPYYLDIHNFHYNHTALHLAVVTGQPGVVRALVVRGASVTKQDFEGNTAMHLACRLGEIDCLRQLTNPLSLTESQTLQQINCHQTDSVSNTTHDFSMKNYEGETCLHVTLGSTVQSIQSRVNIIMYLLVSLAMDVNLQEGKCGYTVLHQAIKMSETDIIKFLLYQPSIDVNRSCYNGSTPLSLAKSLQQHDIVAQLMSLGAVDKKCEEIDCSSDSEDDQMEGFDDLMI